MLLGRPHVCPSGSTPLLVWWLLLMHCWVGWMACMIWRLLGGAAELCCLFACQDHCLCSHPPCQVLAQVALAVQQRRPYCLLLLAEQQRWLLCLVLVTVQ